MLTNKNVAASIVSTVDNAAKSGLTREDAKKIAGDSARSAYLNAMAECEKVGKSIGRKMARKVLTAHIPTDIEEFVVWATEPSE